jgi:hypothetical protein
VNEVLREDTASGPANDAMGLEWLYGLSVLGVSVTKAAEFAERKRRRALPAGLGFPIVTPTALSAGQHDAPPPQLRRRTPAAGGVSADVTGRQEFGAELLNQSIHSY